MKTPQITRLPCSIRPTAASAKPIIIKSWNHSAKCLKLIQQIHSNSWVLVKL